MAERASRRAEWARTEAARGTHLCGCGCGEPVAIRPTHYPTVPRFLHGHNARGPRKPPKPTPPCACGCGALVTPGRRFVSGHNGRGVPATPERRAKISAAHMGIGKGRTPWNKLPPKPTVDCACGCGDVAGPGRRFISGHNVRGARLSNYRGRYFKPSTGYAYVEVGRDHPFGGRDGWMMEHRAAMEAHLRDSQPESPFLVRLGDQLYLSPEAVVHHRNGDKADNAIGNLEVMTRGAHTAHHHEQGDIRG